MEKQKFEINNHFNSPKTNLFPPPSVLNEDFHIIQEKIGNFGNESTSEIMKKIISG